MMQDKHFASRMLICAGGLMNVSGALTAVCAEPAYGGILLAASACMFSAARSFRIAENQREAERQEPEHAHEKES